MHIILQKKILFCNLFKSGIEEAEIILHFYINTLAGWYENWKMALLFEMLVPNAKNLRGRLHA